MRRLCRVELKGTTIEVMKHTSLLLGVVGYTFGAFVGSARYEGAHGMGGDVATI